MNKVENAIEECEKHLIQTESFNSEIEAYLTRYLLLLISSYFEEELEKAFIERAMLKNDSFVIEYFKKEMPQKLKSVGIAKLSEFIKRFGNNYKESFDSEITSGLAQEVTLYGNLIKNRHLVAHETQEPTMTFREVVDAYQKSVKVLDKVKEIINQ